MNACPECQEYILCKECKEAFDEAVLAQVYQPAEPVRINIASGEDVCLA
jgi:hypothetical protein